MKKKIIISIVFIFMLVGASFLSAKYSMHYTENLLNVIYSEKLADIQASLSFNHLRNYKKIQQHLENGCNQAAIEHLKHYQESQVSLIHHNYINEEKTYIDKMNYILRKDPEIYKEIKEYKDVPNKSWTVPNCN